MPDASYKAGNGSRSDFDGWQISRRREGVAQLKSLSSKLNTEFFALFYGVHRRIQRV
jgi:hypothetical protein